MGLALRLFVVGVLLLLVPPLVETAALPVGSATDGNSVRLVDGDAGSVFDGDSFNNDNGAAFNVDAVYTMGDSDNPSESHSLRVVNYGEEARGATVSYEGFDDLGDP
ncbi:MAG: hypothetical protein SXQ77_13110, partial [Halobacteria archaeon]|nr:hypothetical protein [Halobacteria archaeon]